MKEGLKKFPKINIFMIVLSLVGIVGFVLAKNWQAAIWAFNTALWCHIAGLNDVTIGRLRDENSRLLEEKYRK